MQARVLRFTINPEGLDATHAAIERVVLPALWVQHGYVCGALLGDRHSGDAVTVTLWESTAALRAWEQSEAQRTQLASVLPHLVSFPERQVYTVGFRIPIEGTPASARTIAAELKPGATEAATEAFADIVEGTLKDQPGFDAALFLIDPDSSRVLSITAWESDAALRASASAPPVRASLAHFGGYVVGEPRVRSWELWPLR